VRVRAAVNAAGPWVGDLDPSGTELRLARGVHLVFPRRRLPIGHAVALPAADGGNTFAVPRGGVTYVGTTDRPFRGDPAQPDVPEEEVRYLFAVLRAAFPAAELLPRDLLAVYAGVRPLVARGGAGETRELSRRRSIEVRGDGLVSVRGGKLTGFRGVATDTLRTLQRMGLRCLPPAPELAEAFDPRVAVARLAGDYALPQPVVREIVARHGPVAAELLRYARGRPEGLNPVAAEAALLWGEVDFAAAREEIFDLSDLLIRRTGFLWFGGLEEPSAVLVPVAQRIAPELGWSQEEVARQVAACRQHAHLDRLHELRQMRL
jgi:glycerol-3-phosphate dehydrogenase